METNKSTVMGQGASRSDSYKACIKTDEVMTSSSPTEEDYT
jgi:hypothetical protein